MNWFLVLNMIGYGTILILHYFSLWQQIRNQPSCGFDYLHNTFPCGQRTFKPQGAFSVSVKSDFQ